MAAPTTTITGSDTAGWITLIMRAGTTESTATGAGHSTSVAGGRVTPVLDAKGVAIGIRLWQPPVLP
jgi:hypothetical protein